MTEPSEAAKAKAVTVKRRRASFESFYVTVEAEIDVEDILDAGYHHEEDCPNRLPLPDPHPVNHDDSIRQALASLHRQAHPSQHPDQFLCSEEPCRSLPMDAILIKASIR